MTFLPIVARELRRAARQRGLFRLRGLMALLTSGFAGLVLLAGYFSRSNQMGATVFSAMVTTAFIYCLFEGLRSADVLSEEKREGTLGLLFLTDLRAYDVVLGKLAAVGVRSLQGLLAFLPVLAIALVLGGVTGGEFWRAALMLLAVMFWALSIGLCMSALSEEAHVSLLRTGGTLLGLALIPALLLDPFLPGASQSFLGAVSPITALRQVDDLAHGMRPVLYWQSLATIFALSGIALVLAQWAVGRSVCPRKTAVERQDELHARRRTRIPALDRLITGTDTERAEWRRHAFDINPIYWLALRNPRLRRLAVVMASLPVLVDCLMVAGARLEMGALGFSAVLVGIMGIWWTAWRSVRVVSEARLNGALELLLTTPLRLEAFVQGQWLAFQTLFKWPAVIFVASMVIGFFPWTEFSSLSLSLLGPMLAWAGTTSYFILKTATALLAVFWLGLWFGLTRQKTVSAFLLTILVGWVGPKFLFCIPDPLIHLCLFGWARSRVTRDFYRVAAGENLRPWMNRSPLRRFGPPVPPLIPQAPTAVN